MYLKSDNSERDLKFTVNHLWIDMDEYFIGTCGITEYAIEKYGYIKFIELIEINMEVNQYEKIGTIETQNDILSIISPLSGEIISINEIVFQFPEKVNSDPLQDGWIFKIDIKNKYEFMDLFSYSQYEEFIKQDNFKF